MDKGGAGHVFPLSLAKHGVARVDEKSGSRAAALQIATWKYYAGLSRTSSVVLVSTPGGTMGARLGFHLALA